VSGVNLRLDAESVDSARPLLAGARWLLLQHEIPDAANVAAARAARGAGVRTILNAAPARPFAEGLAGLLDILAVNAIEAEALGSPPFDTLAAAAEAATHLLRYAEAAVVTAGGAGVAIATRAGAKATIPGHAVKVVSTHGAGDCFIGALAARLARGETLADAARWANATAALRVSGRSAPGASGGPATLADLLQALG
jgi:ribokinase